MVKKFLRQNKGSNIFWTNPYGLVNILKSKFTLTQDKLNRALNNWVHVLFRKKKKLLSIFLGGSRESVLVGSTFENRNIDIRESLECA